MKKCKIAFHDFGHSTQLLGLLIVLAIMTACKNDVINDNANPAKYRFLAAENTPFNYSENGQANGISVDILESVLGKMNHNESRGDIKITDWQTAYQTALDEPCNMLLSVVKTTDRDSQFKWVGPITDKKEIAVTLRASNVTIKAVTDLNNFFTGVAQDDDVIDILLDKGVHRANIIVFDNVTNLYKAFVNDHEVQCIACSQNRHELAVQVLGLSTDLFATPYTIENDNLYFAFNKDADDDMIADFQYYLDSLKNGSNGAYADILDRYREVQHGIDNVTEDMVVSLVDQTASDIASDAPGTINKINQGLAPYKNQTNSALFTFVYNKDVVMIAHATAPSSVGSSSKGLPDAAGIYFRDDLVSGALLNGTGWVNYISTKRDGGGLFFTTAYYKLVTGSDSKQYIVCSKRFK